MKLNEIKAIAEMMNSADLNCIEITDGEFKLRMERGSTTAAPVKVGKAAVREEDKTQTELAPEAPAVIAGQAVKSPMVGVLYSGSSPDAPPFVTIGSRVCKGDVLCIIEAMKLMNEVVAENDGTVADICAKNGEVVEYGQLLFIIN